MFIYYVQGDALVKHYHHDMCMNIILLDAVKLKTEWLSLSSDYNLHTYHEF